jgi:hypothetical protein
VTTPTDAEDRPQATAWQRWTRPIKFHRVTTALIYVVAFVIAWRVYQFPESTKSILAILATGSIFGTMGSAIMTMFGLWEKDLQERITLDLDILHRDILKNENPWRRWTFLKRHGKWTTYSGDTLLTELTNPPIQFNVGSHEEAIELPSVPADYYDLSVTKNLLKMIRFRRAFITKTANDHPPGTIEKLSKYTCIHDIWTSIFYFRVTRYAMHFGAGIIFAGVLMVLWHITHFTPQLVNYNMMMLGK